MYSMYMYMHISKEIDLDEKVYLYYFSNFTLTIVVNVIFKIIK